MALIRIAALDLAGGLLAPYESPWNDTRFLRHTDLIAAQKFGSPADLRSSNLICVNPWGRVPRMPRQMPMIHGIDDQWRSQPISLYPGSVISYFSCTSINNRSFVEKIRGNPQ